MTFFESLFEFFSTDQAGNFATSCIFFLLFLQFCTLILYFNRSASNTEGLREEIAALRHELRRLRDGSAAQ